MRRLHVLILLMLLPLLSGCRPHTVRISFAPVVGTTYTYEVRVSATSDLVVDGDEPQHREDQVDLIAVHTVLASSDGATRVQVRLSDAEGSVGARTYMVRYDRGGQLTAIDQIEELPADLLGDVGLGEIFPAAAASPPSRPLRPGQRWAIAGPIDLPGAVDSGLVGFGRLDRLGVENGQSVATIATSTTLDVRRERVLGRTRTALTGQQANRSLITHDLSDGSVTRSTSVTNGAFDLLVEPNDDTTTGAVAGRLRVSISSETRRMG